MSDTIVKEEIAVLFHAALIGRTDVVQNAISIIHSTCSDEETIALISSGRVEDGATPMHLAALAGHSDVIRYLLNANADLDVMPSRGTVFLNKRPYDIVAESAKQAFHVYMFEQIAMGRVESINRLLRGGVPATIKDGFKLDESTLHWACSFNNIEVAKLLLSSGVLADVPNMEGQTPLHLACKSLNVEMIKLLLSEGASMIAPDLAGITPKSLLPLHNDEIEKLMTSPPAITSAFRNIYLKKEQDLADLKKCTDSAKADLDTSAIRGSDISDTSQDGMNNLNAEDNLGLIQGAGSSNSVGQNNFADSDVEQDFEFGDCGSKDPPLLVLWPPAKRQVRPGLRPLVLSSLETVLIHVACDSTDIYPILSRSGLIAVLEGFNLTTSVKRPARESTAQPSPMIRFCVDGNLCPGHHRFEVEVNSDYVSILASDLQGGLYGLYVFIQVLQLHSALKFYSNGDVALQITPITIIDWPDVMHRGVMWSMRERARTRLQTMKEMAELLSRLRINILYLVIDPISVHEGVSRVEGERKGGNQTESNDGSNENDEGEYREDSLSNHVTALDEICEGIFLEVVPTVVLSSVNDLLSLSLLKSFSHTMICLMFTFDLSSVKAEMVGEMFREGKGRDVSDSVCENACRIAFESAFSTAMEVGFSSVTFSCSEWAKRVANPRAMAGFKGLNAVERSVDQLCPPSLILKPVYFAQDYIRSLQTQSMRAFMDADFMMPSLSLKYYCFLHAGFAWNADAVVDMTQVLGTGDSESPSAGAFILKEVVSLLLLSKGTDEEPSGVHTAMLDVFAGEVFYPKADVPGPIKSVPPLLLDMELSPCLHVLADTEAYLWAMLHSPVPVHDASCPSRDQASHLLRHYRRLLGSSKWRLPAKKGGLLMTFAFGPDKVAEENPFELELDSFFCVVQVLSVLCRAIVLAHNTYEKSAKNSAKSDVSFGRLMRGLSPGTKSDIANALLASLDHCALNSKRRFQSILVLDSLSLGLDSDGFEITDSCTSSVYSTSAPITRANSASKLIQDPSIAARARYLTQNIPGLPALAVLKTIGDLMPIPESIEVTLLSIFS